MIRLGLVWLASPQSDGISACRFIARDWDWPAGSRGPCVRAGRMARARASRGGCARTCNVIV